MSQKNRLDAIDALLGRVAYAMSGLAAALLLPMMFLVTGDVIGRSPLFKSPIPAVFEINSYFLMTATVFFPLAFVHRKKEHVFVSLFTDKLSTPIVSFLEAASSAIGLLVFALIGWFGVVQAYKSTLVLEATSGVVDVPVWIAKWLMPAGCFLFCLELALHALRNFGKALGRGWGGKGGA